MSKAVVITKLSKAEHRALLKRAVIANLTARLDHDKRLAEAAQGKPVEATIWNGGDLLRADVDWLYLDDVIKVPIRKALRKQLKDLGKRLFRLLGNTEEMLTIAQEAAEATGEWGYAIDVVDKTWDGIGSKTDVWTA
jgi:hypothetical protein